MADMAARTAVRKNPDGSEPNHVERNVKQCFRTSPAGGMQRWRANGAGVVVKVEGETPPEPNKVLPEVMSYALAELTEEEEVEQQREIKDILAQVHAETASAIAAEEATESKAPLSPVFGGKAPLTPVSQCKVKRTNDDDTFERNVKTMLSAGVLAGITSIWDYQSQIRKAEASTKFRDFVRDDMEIMKELGMKSYNTGTLTDAYINIHREVKKIYTKTMFLLEGTANIIIKAATDAVAVNGERGAKIMVAMIAKAVLDSVKEELADGYADTKQELDAVTDTKEQLDAATDTKEELDAATVAETELEVYVTRCEWCECVCELAKELMKKVEIEISAVVYKPPPTPPVDPRIETINMSIPENVRVCITAVFNLQHLLRETETDEYASFLDKEIKACKLLAYGSFMNLGNVYEGLTKHGEAILHKVEQLIDEQGKQLIDDNKEITAAAKDIQPQYNWCMVAKKLVLDMLMDIDMEYWDKFH
jgi:hypothetical protein